MAIADMRKLNLIAMSYDKDAILNSLQKTGAVEITLHSERANTLIPHENSEELKEYLDGVENSLKILSNEVEEYNKKNKIKSSILKDGFEVSYSDFMAAKGAKSYIDKSVEKISRINSDKNDSVTELLQVQREKVNCQIYKELTIPFSTYSDTLHTKCRVGTISNIMNDKFVSQIVDQSLMDYEKLSSDGEKTLYAIYYHKCAIEESNEFLSQFEFTDSPKFGNKTGKEIFEELERREKVLSDKITADEYEMYEMKGDIHPLKIYSDYVAFELEKLETSDKLRSTEKTFLLEAYVPVQAEEIVREELGVVTKAVYYEFSEPGEDEMTPTLMQNNAVVSNFETITNLYSPPNSHEIDPNTVMAFFYSLFMGFIMGDMGYGIIMALGGWLVYNKFKSRDCGLKRMAGVFAMGGIFAILWGILFNSLFGMPLPFMKSVMPDPQKDMWSFAGIAVPSVLIISFLIGILQLFAGYICKAFQSWHKGSFWDGIWDGVIWAIFSLGAGLAIVGFVKEFNLPILAKIGGITAGVSLVLAMLTAGRHEKILGKFSKGFGAVYGIVNYASDILSYARLYGLMLSGAVIAQIISQYSIGFITGGNILVAVLGMVLMLVGHAFNLAMSLLGAYIHDARLQYVEFYGKFFEGEGQLFEPLGSKHKYIWLTPAKKVKNS